MSMTKVCVAGVCVPSHPQSWFHPLDMSNHTGAM